jgi:putative flippase GtrA
VLQLSRIPLAELIRYYMAGAVNAAFGYGLFAALVWAGMGMYLAQIIAHVLGVAFNYFTYSRHVFRSTPGAQVRFVASYAVNYLISLGFLAAGSLFIHSPYLAGLFSIIATSVVNYFVLKKFVFVRGAH